MTAVVMTLSDVQAHSPAASLTKCDFRTVAQQLTRQQEGQHPLTGQRAPPISGDVGL